MHVLVCYNVRNNMAFFQDGMLTAKIETKNEIYHIEPSWRHLQGEEKKLEGTFWTTFFSYQCQIIAIGTRWISSS